jgi:small GTP-binding protein
LKPDNILLDRFWEPKLSDFACAQYVFSPDGDTAARTCRFMAPELLSGQACDLPADVYSFGCVVYSLFTGAVPFAEHSSLQVAMKVMNGERPRVPETVPPQYRDLITACWNSDSRARPTMHDVKAMFWTSKFLTGDINIRAFRTYLMKVRLVAARLAIPSQDRVKIVLAGDSGVGKTAIFQRLYGKPFPLEYMPTITFNFGECIFRPPGATRRSIGLWDTAGEEGHRSLAPVYFRGAQCIIVVFDITDRSSFEGVGRWIQMARYHGAEFILVGNKADLETDRKVTYEEANMFASMQGALWYLDISAKTDESVLALLEDFSTALPSVAASLPQVVLDQDEGSGFC